MAQTLEEFLVNVKYNVDVPSQQRFFDALKRVATSVAGVTGALTGLGIEVMRVSEKMAAAGEKLYWMSQRVGDSVSDIQGMAFAMSNLGVSADQAMSGIERFGAWTRSMGPAATGYLHSLGITATDTVGRMKQLGDYFRQGGGTQAMQGTIEYALMLRRASMMGIDENTMLALSSGRMEQSLQQAGIMQRLVWGKDWQTGPQQFAAQSVLVMNQFRQMGFFFSNLSQQFGLGLFHAILPDLQKINDLLISTLPDLRTFLDHVISYAPMALHFLEGVIKAFDWLLNLANFAMEQFDKLPHSIDLMIGGILMLPSALRLIGSPLFWLIAGFTSLLLLMDDYKHYQDDLKHPGEKKTAYFDWGDDTMFGKAAEFAKTLGQFAEDHPWMVGVIGGMVLLNSKLGLISGTLGGMLGPARLILAALEAIAAVYIGNKEGQEEIRKKAEAMGFEEVPAENMWSMPTFRNKKTGEVIPYGEMMGRQGRQHGGGGWIERGLHWFFGGGGTSEAPRPGDPAARGLILGQAQRLGGYQTASLGDDWMPPSAFRGAGRREEFYTPDRFFVMLRDNGEAIIERLSDILDTLTDMAEGQGAPRTMRGGFGSTVQAGVPGDQAATADELMTMVMEEWGVDQYHAAPIVSAMLRESKGHADISYGGGPLTEEGTQAIGLQQLTGIRHTRFIEWARANGLNPRDKRVQVRYGHLEAERDYPGWRAATESSNPEAFGDLVEAGGVHGGYTHGNYTDFLRHRALGSDSTGATSGGGGRRAPDYNNAPSLVNNTHISVVAPNPASAGYQVAEHQQRVFEHHVRYAAGRFLA